MATEREELKAAVEEIGLTSPIRIPTVSGGRGIITLEFDKGVRPGDLITAEFMNRLLRRVAQLENALASVEAGKPVGVPNFFGMSLFDAAEAVRQTGGNLVMGRVLNVLGTSVLYSSGIARECVVLAHFPVPDANVGFRTSVDFVVSAGGLQTANSFGGRLAQVSTGTKDIFTDVVAKFLGNEFEKRVPTDYFTRNQNIKGTNVVKETVNEESATNETTRAAKESPRRTRRRASPKT